MNKALLDTDTFSEIFKGLNAVVARHAKTYRRSFGHYSISTVTLVEIVRGCQQKQAHQQLRSFLAAIKSEELISLDPTTAELAGRISGDLNRTGQPIGVADPMIAATALVHGLELVTGNTSHFERVQRLGYPLILVNWRF